MEKSKYPHFPRRHDQPTFGAFLVSASATMSEVLASSELDWIMVDGEASSISREAALHCLRGIDVFEKPALFRLAGLTRHEVEHALDQGFHGILLPRVESPSEVEDLVSFANYPPIGNRGVNPIRASIYFDELSSYLQSANEHLLLGIQIETRAGLENIDAIINHPQIDFVFVGPGDLAASLGYPGNVSHPVVEEACQHILNRCRHFSKQAGIFAYSRPLARYWADQGFRMIAVTNEIKALKDALRSILSGLRT